MQDDQSKETKQQEQIVSLFFKLDQIVQNQNIQIDFSRRQLEEMRKGNEIAKTNSEYTRKFLLMEADKGRGRRRDETMKATLCHALAVLEADLNHNIKIAAEKVFHN